MALLTSADLLNGQILQFAQGNNDLNPQAVQALQSLSGQNSGIDMAAIQSYFQKVAGNQNAQQLLEQLSADPANYVNNGGAEAAPTLNPEALAKYQAMVSDPGAAPTVNVGGSTYSIRQDGNGGYILDSGDTGVHGQQMTLGLNANGTYGNTGAWNPGTTWTQGGREIAIMAALAAAGGAAFGGGSGMAANTVDGAATSADMWAQTAAQANGLQGAGTAAGSAGTGVADTFATPADTGGTTANFTDAGNVQYNADGSAYQSGNTAADDVAAQQAAGDAYTGAQPSSISSGTGNNMAWTGEGDTVLADGSAANVGNSGAAIAPNSAGIDWTSLLKNNGGDIFKAVASLANQNSSTAAQTRAANTAADASVFKPFNVSTATGTASAARNADGSISASSQLSPDLQNLTRDMTRSGADILAGVNGNSVNNAGQTAWDKYNAWARPNQQTMFGQLQDRMAGQGLLGLTSYAPNVNGGQGGNPMYQDFAAGVEQQDQKAYQDIITNALANLTTQSNLGTSQINSATGIQNQANSNLALGANLANQNNNLNANAANTNYNAASAGAAGNSAMWGNIINAVAPAAGKVINSML